MTENDDDTATESTQADFLIKNVPGIDNPRTDGKYERQFWALEAVSIKFMLWWRLPWIGSAAIIIIAIILYFHYNGGPEKSFNEAVLGIIIGGAATMGVSGAFSLSLNSKN